MRSPLNFDVLPVSVVVLGLLHEGLRVVLRSAIGPTVPRREPCLKQILRTKILVTERHAAVRTPEAKLWSRVMKSCLSTGNLVTPCSKILFHELACHDAGGPWFLPVHVWLDCLLR